MALHSVVFSSPALGVYVTNKPGVHVFCSMSCVITLAVPRTLGWEPLLHQWGKEEVTKISREHKLSCQTQSISHHDMTNLLSCIFSPIFVAYISSKHSEPLLPSHLALFS